MFRALSDINIVIIHILSSLWFLQPRVHIRVAYWRRRSLCHLGFMKTKTRNSSSESTTRILLSLHMLLLPNMFNS